MRPFRVFPALLCCVALLFALGGAPARAQGQDPRAAASAFNSAGSQAYSSGHLDQALSLFQRSLDAFQSAGDRNGTSVALANVGLVYARLGQNSRAMDYYNRALALKDPNDPAIFDILVNLGDGANALGQPQAAISYLNRALDVKSGQHDRKTIAAVLDSLGHAYSRLRQWDKSVEYGKQALEVIQPTGDLREIARILGNLGATYKGKGEPDTAVRYLNLSLDIKRKFASRGELAGSLTNLALLYFDLNKLPESASAFGEAIYLDEVLSREVREASKIGAFQDWFRSSLYRRYAHVLINQGKTEEALTVLERGRGQGLARQAAQNRADYSKVLSGIDAGRLRQTMAQYNAASAAFRQIEGFEFLADEGRGAVQQQVQAIRRRFDDAERQLNTLRGDLYTRYPAYRRMTGGAPPTAADFKELAAKNPDTLYLQWAVGAESTSLLFAVSQKEGVKSFVIPVGEGTLIKQVGVWRAALQAEDPRAEPGFARAVYNSLFSAVEKAGMLAPGKYARLVLVGDGPLLEAPYGALLDNEGKRLIERYPITVSPSFGVLTWPDDRDKPTASLLVAADPLSPGNHPLPAARKEGQAVAQLFPTARLLVGAEATRDQVLPDLSKYGILHFATHGMLDPDDGLRSGLLLASDRGKEETQLLEAGELINMRLSAQLAVLSACETGEGQHNGGDGLLGLTWAFRAAGCPSIVASLWSVDDDATGQLMVQFYQNLKAGQRKDEALRAAMLTVKGRKPLPFYWAAFQLSGDASAVKL